MNITHLEHALYALLMQAIFVAACWRGRLPGEWLGAAFAIGWFVSREHAQREYHLFTYGEPNTLSDFAGFTGWSQDAVLDAVVPALVVLVAGAVITRLRRASTNRSK